LTLIADHLDHLPDRKRREIARVMQVLFEEFEEGQKTKLSEKKRAGRILSVILFGSYARGDWVEDHKSGYRSDYDLLVVVNTESFAEENEIWHHVSERFLQDYAITNQLQTPVNFIVHSLMDVNDQLSRGVPFFVDIARDGIMLYEEPGHPLAKPKPLTPADARAQALAYYERWYPLSIHGLKLAHTSIENRVLSDAAFMLHQATERAYHCVLLTLSLYSPKSHRLKTLRSAAERIEPRLIDAWPRDTKFFRRSFERLDRAYVDARYSAQYTITDEELSWLVERIKILQELVCQVCEERLAG
jgi:predicted nucleotidyltransferase/HEPN domain-containing protein